MSFDDAWADSLLTGLVSRYSPSREERAAVEYLVAEMKKAGFDAYIDGAGNAVGELGAGSQTLLLLGHIDTVPGQVPIRIEGDRFYGRGAVDAKGPLATFAVAAARVGALPGKRIVVVGAVEEECATSKGARYLLDRLNPAAVVIGEPSGWDRLAMGYKGRLLVNYARSRDLGHTAGPESSVCDDAFAFWQAVIRHAEAFNAQRSRVFEQLTPSLRSMHSEGDGLRETAALRLGFRLPPGVDVDALQSALVGYANGGTLTFEGREVAYRGEKQSPLARAFVRAITLQGAVPKFSVKSGTSDMNVVGPVWGCPILAYGPGDSTLDHTPHEHILLSEYHRAIEVLQQVLITF